MLFLFLQALFVFLILFSLLAVFVVGLAILNPVEEHIAESKKELLEGRGDNPKISLFFIDNEKKPTDEKDNYQSRL